MMVINYFHFEPLLVKGERALTLNLVYSKALLSGMPLIKFVPEENTCEEMAHRNQI